MHAAGVVLRACAAAQARPQMGAAQAARLEALRDLLAAGALTEAEHAQLVRQLLAA